MDCGQYGRGLAESGDSDGPFGGGAAPSGSSLAEGLFAR